jgi:hypothetical protein
MYACYWNEEDNANYVDLYDLIHKIGIPDEIRPRIWKEFFKV